MFKSKTILISIIIVSLFSSCVLLLIGIVLTGTSDLLEISPNYKKNSKIASFVTAGIQILISGACGLYTYTIKRSEPSVDR